MAYIDKWQDFKTHEDWRSRTENLVELVPKECRTLIELGAGKNSARKQVLNLGIKYQSSDITEDPHIDFRLDVNQLVLPVLEADVILFSGLLEYVYNPTKFLSWCASSARIVIGSYAPILTLPMSVDEALQRSNNGWKNHMSLEQLANIGNNINLNFEFAANYQSQVLFRAHHV